MIFIAVRKPRVRYLACIAVAICGQSFADSDSSVIAEKNPVYESLEDVAVGKVFFSSAERERLDHGRAKKPLQSRVNSSTPSSRATPKHDKKAAGYIVSSRGTVKVYSRGDFVAGDGAKRVVFPGSVKIERAAADDAQVESDAPE